MAALVQRVRKLLRPVRCQKAHPDCRWKPAILGRNQMASRPAADRGLEHPGRFLVWCLGSRQMGLDDIGQSLGVLACITRERLLKVTLDSRPLLFVMPFEDQE